MECIREKRREMISEALSYKFRNVGFVCACLVVPIHVAHPTVGSGVWLDRVLAGAISNVAVPMFFVISEFLLGEKVSQAGWWKREVSKRVKSFNLVEMWRKDTEMLI